ncbi:hypothetical protein BN1221_03500 [Brenneria goodwinii]|uniref:Uncharacterized protein n=1 Tax=Brenneria goodwinii TaxID=1109412 RepID=A0A0G4JYK2_9GAMM|nr:hypothetical protein BN1221_03500 [Brenneria goodwinii]
MELNAENRCLRALLLFLAVDVCEPLKLTILWIEFHRQD